VKTAPIYALRSISNVHDAPLARAEPAKEGVRLSPGFTIQTDCFAKAEWDDIILNFQDASLYQSAAYSGVRWGEKNLSHLVLKQEGEILGAAQVILARLPVLRSGLAYAKWGPLWQLKDGRRNLHVLRHLLRSLRQTYAVERRLLLRISPWEWDDEGIKAVFNEEGFVFKPVLPRAQTAILDLSCSLEELRASLTRHWRHNLKEAEKNNLEIVEGSTKELAATFSGLYAEMRARKSGGWIPPIGYLGALHSEMRDGMKPWISICRHQGEPTAGLVISALGTRGLALFAATGDKGLNLRSSYLLWWRAIERLKAQGVLVLDVGGIDEKTHPGTSQFKLGLSGKLGRKVEYLGDFYAWESWTSRFITMGGDSFRMALIKARESFCEWRRARETQGAHVAS